MKIFIPFMSALLICLTGCSDLTEPDYREHDYGHVQFKLYKRASYEPKSSVIDYLADIAKVSVELQTSDGASLSQTLVLSASSAEAAEFGLRSEKLQLLAGKYSIRQYDLYDKMDKMVVSYRLDAGDNEFEIVPGGLHVHDILADVVERGSVKFSLIKDLTEVPQTKAVAGKDNSYTFDEIAYVTIALKNTDIEFKMLPAKFSIDFDEDKTQQIPGDKGWQTSSFECDTLVYLRAGHYEVKSYTVYDKSKNELEINDQVQLAFDVTDNVTTRVEVPVRLHENAYIKDYRALKKIYDALDGENWYYEGDEWPVGSKWNFDKDIDLWGAQPGVKLHDNGRVALLSLSGFGFSGDMPAELGDLTELVELYLGNHNEAHYLDKDPTVQPGMSSANRMSRHKEYLRRTHRLTQFSEPIATGMKIKGKSIPEIALYDEMTAAEILDAQGRMKIKPMDDALAGTKTNGLKSLPATIANLKKLSTLFIANGDIEELPAELAECSELTDLEIYNCPEMKNFPTVISKLAKLTSANLSANPQWVDVDEGLVSLATGPSGKALQILYMNECSLTTLPSELNNMKKLGLLSVASNKITTIESAYPDLSFVQLYLDNNQIESIPSVEKDGRRIFFRIEDVETFSCTYNKISKFPDIFHSNSQFGMSSVDFSYNEITEIENADAGYQGIYVATLSIANNPGIKKYPVCFAKSKSKIDYLNLRGCGIEEIPEGSFIGENVKYLVSLDLSYNKIKDFPREFTAVSCPYFYGLDLSFNMLSEFPYEPLDCASLTTLAVRGQRNEKGDRSLSEWPNGISNHTGLRALYLGSNDLGKINDRISYLIYILDITDNPNIVFDASDICYNWLAGTYMLYYTKGQKILNCEEMLQ